VLCEQNGLVRRQVSWLVRPGLKRRVGNLGAERAKGDAEWAGAIVATSPALSEPSGRSERTLRLRCVGNPQQLDKATMEEESAIRGALPRVDVPGTFSQANSDQRFSFWRARVAAYKYVIKRD
jgi:hypothetical protein